tara:strand:+ start:74 stop:406 length:333 start_codon:yes stop_codon:yes gene_type:complete
MTVEQRLEQLKKRNKRLTVGLTMIAVTIAAVVTMAATNVRDVSNSEIGRWEFHRDQRVPAVLQHADAVNGKKGMIDRQPRSHYLLDTVTGEMWQIGLALKQRVVEAEDTE